MDEFNTKRISIFLLFLVAGFFLMPFNVLGACGDFGSVSTSAQDYCQYLGPSSGYTDCEGSGERAYFSASGDLVNYRCYDMCRPFGICSCTGVFACSGCTSRSGTYQNCLTICGSDCDSECVDAKDCSTDNQGGIETSGHLAGCVYLNGRSCTTPDGSSGVCSNGVCIVNRYIAPKSLQIRIWQGTSTSIYNSIIDWTSVSCSSGNNPYTCKYYIGTSSDPAFCQYEGNYYFQWRFQSSTGTWYYTDSSGNYVARTSSSPSGVFMYNINYDSDSNDCECKVGTGHYNLGGEISGCCGDDANEFVSSGVGDNTLDPYFISSDSKACCNSNTDCVYNNNCYTSNTQGPDVDQDGDYDWCGYPGTWRDCNTSAQCGGGTVFGEYEVCINNDCKVACYNQPCVAGYSECVDEISGETLYCMNSTSSASQSSYVENPTGGNTNERYCHQDQYYDPVFGCQPKEGEDICYNYLDPTECGTGNTASVVYCNLVGEYCSFDDGTYKDIVKIESTNAPLQVVGKGPMSPTSTSGECIDTDSGDKPKEWGCVYIMTAEKNNEDDFQIVVSEMGCDYVSDGKLIEFYCSGGEILAKEYTCEKIIKTEDNTSYCFKTPSDSRSVTPPKKDHPIHKP
ncbi:MAG: hypothetical protein PWQ28_3 [Candidatus Woesearchaeota archaeon]|nr:hypothetical protein [Candidatus Woesearchaeota archaeon]